MEIFEDILNFEISAGLNFVRFVALISSVCLSTFGTSPDSVCICWEVPVLQVHAKCANTHTTALDSLWGSDEALKFAYEILRT